MWYILGRWEFWSKILQGAKRCSHEGDSILAFRQSWLWLARMPPVMSIPSACQQPTNTKITPITNSLVNFSCFSVLLDCLIACILHSATQLYLESESKGRKSSESYFWIQRFEKDSHTVAQVKEIHHDFQQQQVNLCVCSWSRACLATSHLVGLHQ